MSPGLFPLLLFLAVLDATATLPITGARSDATRTHPEIQKQNAIRWEQRVIETRNSTAGEKIRQLWPAPESLGSWIDDGRADRDTLAAYQKVIHEILSIPGYAGVFTDEIEARRKEAENHPAWGGKRIAYDKIRRDYILRTFPHLPAPETLKALGVLLADERDTPPPPEAHQDWGGTPSNSVLASNALTRIGLIDPPRHHPAEQKQWWGQVKAGKRWFAFHGQPVSYRFREDGTAETKPRDPSGDPRWVVSTRSFDLAREPDRADTAYWLMGGAAAVLAALIAAMVRRRTKRGAPETE